MSDKAHVVTRLDARHGEERHRLAGAVQRAGPRSRRNADLHRAVGRPLPVTVDLCVAGGAELFEPTRRDVHVSVTLQTLPLGHSLTDAALPQSVVQQVGDVQAESRKDGVKHFEVLPKPGHEQQETGRSLNKLEIGRAHV